MSRCIRLRERGGFEQRFTDENFAVQVVLRKIFS